MSTLSFTVLRREPVLVGPASPTTSRERKRLSDIDDQDELRSHIRGIFFYRGGGLARGDPVDIIRRALSEALVHYYPLAGRLREVGGRKLVVDCTGEGVTFVEADADVRLADLEADVPGLMPPFPWIKELCFEVEGSSAVLNCPLVIIQVSISYLYVSTHIIHAQFEANNFSCRWSGDAAPVRRLRRVA